MNRSKYPYKPTRPVAPGLQLEEYLEVRNFSYEEFAQRCSCSPQLISGIVSGEAPISDKLARQFERVLGMDANIWIGMERNYRRLLAEKA